MSIIIRMVVAVVAVLAITAGCAADDDTTSGPQTESRNEEHPPPEDIKITECGPDETGWVRAAGVITNHSSKPSTYIIEIEFVDAAGVRYAEGLATSSTVAPGQQVEFEASGLTDSREGRCEVISVERFAS